MYLYIGVFVLSTILLICLFLHGYHTVLISGRENPSLILLFQKFLNLKHLFTFPEELYNLLSNILVPV